jgi:hypothetical protein
MTVATANSIFSERKLLPQAKPAELPSLRNLRTNGRRKEHRKYIWMDSPSPMASCIGPILSGSASLVAVVQSTNLGYCNHSSQLRSLDRPRLRRVLVQRKMWPRLVIVGEITRQGSTQGGFSDGMTPLAAIQAGTAFAVISSLPNG